MSRFYAVCLAVLLLCAPAAFGQEKKKGGPATRTVQGQVSSGDAPVSGAVVYLKNVKTMAVRSFITKADGTYYFHELSPDIDYELRAEWGGVSSPVKTLSSFDTRKQATINLKVEKK